MHHGSRMFYLMSECGINSVLSSTRGISARSRPSGAVSPCSLSFLCLLSFELFPCWLSLPCGWVHLCLDSFSFRLISCSFPFEEVIFRSCHLNSFPSSSTNSVSLDSLTEKSWSLRSIMFVFFMVWHVCVVLCCDLQICCVWLSLLDLFGHLLHKQPILKGYLPRTTKGRQVLGTTWILNW